MRPLWLKSGSWIGESLVTVQHVSVQGTGTDVRRPREITAFLAGEWDGAHDTAGVGLHGDVDAASPRRPDPEMHGLRPDDVSADRQPS